MITNLDRCDKCNAGAKNKFVLNDLQLMFCNHCTNNLSEALESSGWTITEKQTVDA